ncbi:glutathione S-transferase family protein [Bradyrhizobium lablabi]|uniref:glutathione S-transferase family protein n=1 Tax=Bradyrhizobium lablabi TaxID=722472 RepID=UPI001BAD2A18|nr:glutathione S-transferase family protein [Bradyrhizobium lablabi]MBR1122835.1 glutathione S-transferase family protein [Bradyrhizobium lablabi]
MNSRVKRLKLYHSPAVRSARVKWLLHELMGDDFDVESVTLHNADQYREEFLVLNPNHAVPVLEIAMEDGKPFHMIESGAMVALLADTFPDRKLAPIPHVLSMERADYLQMLHFGASSMDMMLWQIRIHEDVLSATERDDRTIRRYRRKFAAEVEPQLKERLSRAPFICGAGFSAADCVVGYNVLWAQAFQLCSDAVFRDYVARFSARPAFKAAFSDRHQFTRIVPEECELKKRFTG